MKLLIRVLALAAIFATPAFAGNSQSKGNRLILATYWGDDKVALLDLGGESGHEEIWTIDVLKAVGCPKPYDVRSNKRGDEAFVSCSGGDMVAVIDIVAQQVKYTIKTGLSPRDLQLFDDDKKLIVANSGSDTVSIVDTLGRKKLYDVSVSSQPYGVAVTNDNKTALVTGWASGDLHFISLGDSSGVSLGKVDVGLLPYTVAIAGDPARAYVAANASHSVAAVDLASHTVSEQIRVGRNPWSLAASSDGKSLLVTNNRSNNLSLLKTGLAVSAVASSQAFIGAGAQLQPNGDSVNRAAKNASISMDGKTGVFTDLANNQVAVVDLASGEIKKVINVGKAPYGIEFVK
ncbi:YVTN family beta-propeller repeat protein [Bradyrhizobium sp. YR681]|uniref:YncE family protein n=1 Tax=Bradyrhizobium sp. YR681 TaxID=1144344 RepID=UPI00026FBA11|nr:YncE family protein [Bradyrhizobium sp. YR681]EJN08845.1 YVTN family beta-propeller repeat protein [Bradyrhizobium sp. YR681]